MADENEPAGDDAEGETTKTAAGPPPELGSIRDRLGRNRFRRQVRAGFEAGLKKEAAKKKNAQLKAADVEHFVTDLTDTEIDAAAMAVIAEEDSEAEAAGGEKKGPVRDWFAAHPDVGAVVVLLLKALLGAV